MLFGHPNDEREPQRCPVTIDEHDRLLPGAQQHSVRNVFEGRRIAIGDLNYAVARPDSRLFGRASLLDLNDRIARRGHSDRREESREDRNGKHEIRERASKDDQESLPHRAQLEGTVTQFRRDLFNVPRRARRGHVADEFDVAAEGKPADLPSGSLTVRPADDLMAETDRKGLGGNAKYPGDEIVAQFVEEDERAEHADKGYQYQPERRLGEH